MTRASAPGKIILFGEHAVVYGRPAIAVPVRQVRASAAVSQHPDAAPGEILVEAEDLQLKTWLRNLQTGHPIKRIVQLALDALDVDPVPALHIQITSTIPIASGLGSGAAVSIAILRALSEHLERPLSAEKQSALAFEIEKIYHGTPSGIDNTVIAYDQPVYFVSGREHEMLDLGAPLTFILADSGEHTRTIDVVQSVREAWQLETNRYEKIFDEIGRLTVEARRALESDNRSVLGALMNRNHGLLQRMEVSSPKLDQLTQAALQAGALGAKLSGAGRGGNVICLAEPPSKDAILHALHRAGSAWTLATEIKV